MSTLMTAIANTWADVPELDQPPIDQWARTMLATTPDPVLLDVLHALDGVPDHDPAQRRAWTLAADELELRHPEVSVELDVWAVASDEQPRPYGQVLAAAITGHASTITPAQPSAANQGGTRMTTTTAPDLETLRPTWAKSRPEISGPDASWYGPKVRAGGVELRLMMMAEKREDGWHLDRAPRIAIDVNNVLTVAAAVKLRDALDTLISQAEGSGFFV